MATPNTAYRWNGAIVRVQLPASGETVNGEPFTVPPGMKTMSIWVPALAGASGTATLQSLKPLDTVEQSQTWSALTVMNLSTGSPVAIAALAESTFVTIPVSATGGGTLRFVADADNSSSPVTVVVFFTRDG